MLGRALRLPRHERRQALVAAALLAYANVALKLLPFAHAIRLGSIPPRGKRPTDSIRAIVQAVERAGYAVPWRTVCIHQGLVAQRMLRREGFPAILCYGTRQAGGELQSHVWVKLGEEIVIGGDEAPGYHLVAVYPRAEESSTRRPFSSLST